MVAPRQRGPKLISRRELLGQARWAPALFLPAPLFVGIRASGLVPNLNPALPSLADGQISPHYPAHSPLENTLRLVQPGSDSYFAEKYAAELQTILRLWSERLLGGGNWLEFLGKHLQPVLESNIAGEMRETKRSTPSGIELVKRNFAEPVQLDRERFLGALRAFLAGFHKIDRAEFEIVQIKQVSPQPLSVETHVRYAFVGSHENGERTERIGVFNVLWTRDGTEKWQAEKCKFLGENVSSAKSPLFADVTVSMLGRCDSYQNQLVRGTDYWRTVLDGASGIDVYGNNGIAAGDFDNDGFDDLYVCQPSGLPNRLYRNRGDGTFEDVTEKCGVGVLDATSCALFADFQNRGVQDLLVVCDSGPLLFLNQGNGKFALKRDAFSFAKPPQGTFTHAAVADYDRDGRLDIYFCLYTYYLGLDQYHYPSPYFDARNGPPNFLFHNEGNAKFVDRTEASGLNVENDRFSFACAWGDINGNGWPDLYVANDFGRNNLYRNNGDGKFAAVSEDSGANDVGAGMSACWLDFDGDGTQDIYVSNMWSAAGRRVSEQDTFHTNDPRNIKSFYRQHASGNSLYKNQGDGTFKNVAVPTGVEMGRWAWSSDSWDFDHDGNLDLYITNGYISGTQPQELSSFFWRQVVGNSPATSAPSLSYEQGWNAINELIRSDHTWSGYERNTMYVNNHDGTFSDISGVSGLDFLDDGRAFALADLNHDGRLEVILKNRTAPQIRILQNAISEIGDSVSFRLRGVTSNRDAIGAAVTLQTGGLRQTKYLQAGTGFLSQHSKELFFGLGKSSHPISATVRWPSGLTQTFEGIPANHCVTLEEGQKKISAKPFSSHVIPPKTSTEAVRPETLPSSVATWLLDPLAAPEFNLPDSSGTMRTLAALRGKPILLSFWSAKLQTALDQLRSLQGVQAEFSVRGIRIACVNLDEDCDAIRLRAFAANENLTIPLLVGTQDVAGVYNIIYRYVFDRRKNLPLPCSLLLDESSNIVKIYQGFFETPQILADAQSIPRTYEARVAKGLPFPGTLYGGGFQRNDFTNGVALFQQGYLDQAAASFRQVIAAKPDNPEAFYNLGTLYLRKNDLNEAKKYLEKTVSLRPDYPEAWNNLGMIAAQQNQQDDAIRYFQRSIEQRPDYVIGLVNLGNLLRRQGNASAAAKALYRAVELEPENAEANFGLGMLHARQNDSERAEALFRKAIAIRPDYADAINNLGVLLVREGKNAEAEEQFKSCISVAPKLDQAYLNLAQLYMLEKQNDRAREILEALLKLQPQHKLARQTLEMLH